MVLHKVWVWCKNCGKIFLGTKKSKWCPQCSKDKKQNKVMEWQRENKDKMYLYRKNYYLKYYKNDPNFDLEAKLKRLEQRQERNEQKQYCANFDSNRIDCITCYENQVAEYKDCRK